MRPHCGGIVAVDVNESGTNSEHIVIVVRRNAAVRCNIDLGQSMVASLR
jgi:hypothetical protein